MEPADRALVGRRSKQHSGRVEPGAARVRLLPRADDGGTIRAERTPEPGRRREGGAEERLRDGARRHGTPGPRPLFERGADVPRDGSEGHVIEPEANLEGVAAAAHVIRGFDEDVATVTLDIDAGAERRLRGAHMRPVRTTKDDMLPAARGQLANGIRQGSVPMLKRRQGFITTIARVDVDDEDPRPPAVDGHIRVGPAGPPRGDD